MKNKLFKFVFCSICVALFFSLDFLSIKVGPFKFTVSGIAIIVVSLYYGPIEGSIVGLLGSFIGQLLNGYGLTPTTILWVLPAFVRGLYIGLFNLDKKLVDKKWKYVIVLITSALIVTLLNTVTLYVDSKMFGYYTKELVFGSLIYRILSSLIICILYIVVCPSIVRALRFVNNKEFSNSNESFIEESNINSKTRTILHRESRHSLKK